MTYSSSYYNISFFVPITKFYVEVGIGKANEL